MSKENASLLADCLCAAIAGAAITAIALLLT